MDIKLCKVILGNYKFNIDFLENNTSYFIYKKLPISDIIDFRGTALYFCSNLNIKTENKARITVSKGEIVYWLNGDAIAIEC